ncbi:MAG TPA: nitroreductase/quinone reductase family protein [Candidatus Limnocylindria bacterium]|nr:nitroreductase/quinone reductase family protein [Candidatus Limnocylindria bacterium]
MPSVASRAQNFFPNLILRSPLHPVLSGKYTIIEFTGRKSGRKYSTPVAYVKEGERILMTTDSPWWRNMSGGAPVKVWVGGRRREGTATAVTDPERSAAILRMLVDAIPSYAGPAELAREGGRVSDAEIARAVAEGRVAIEVDVEGRA